MISLFIAVALLLPGCGRQAETSPDVAEIKNRSTAAGFLAEKADEGKGFIAGADQRDKASDYAYLYDNALSVVTLSYAAAQDFNLAGGWIFYHNQDDGGKLWCVRLDGANDHPSSSER